MRVIDMTLFHGHSTGTLMTAQAPGFLTRSSDSSVSFLWYILHPLPAPKIEFLHITFISFSRNTCTQTHATTPLMIGCTAYYIILKLFLRLKSFKRVNIPVHSSLSGVVTRQAVFNLWTSAHIISLALLPSPSLLSSPHDRLINQEMRCWGKK